MSDDWDHGGRAFAEQLAEILQLDGEDRFGPSTSLFDDWALDSLQAFAMIVIIESMAGVDVPPPEIPELFTVADAYGYFCSLRASVG